MVKSVLIFTEPLTNTDQKVCTIESVLSKSSLGRRKRAHLAFKEPLKNYIPKQETSFEEVP